VFVLCSERFSVPIFSPLKEDKTKCPANAKTVDAPTAFVVSARINAAKTSPAKIVILAKLVLAIVAKKNKFSRIVSVQL